MDEELFGQETDIDDAIEAFMKSSPDEETLSEDDEEDAQSEDVDDTTEEEAEDEADDEESDADPEESEDDEGEPKPKAKKLASDDDEVTITVDGKEVRASVKDLKRLYGQEASLTQKSQSLAEQRKAVETQGLYIARVLQTRYEAAQAKVAKFKDVDLFRASRELEPDEFDALRAAKEGAESELNALEREGQEFLKHTQATRATMLREQAKESLKIITREIPEWNDEVYGKVRTYAVSQGMDADTVNEIVDPGAILMIHKAMKYDEAQSKKATVTKKVAKAPSKVVKKSDRTTDAESSKLKTIRRAAASGDVDDVADLFMAAMKAKA